MHTRADLLLSGNEEAELKVIASEIAGEIKRLEHIANFFDPDSELSRLNRTASLHPVEASSDLFRMLTLCIRYNEITEGLFDISFRSDNHHAKTLEAVVPDETSQTIHFREEGIRLDLSGFVKGYALDRVKEILAAHAIENALVNLGNSSILALGNHPIGKGWTIQPAAGDEESAPVTLHNQCYTTSGNETSARLHIVNPLTGQYMEDQRTTSVITPSGALGEVLATALFLKD